MSNGILGSRQFTVDDQAWFAELSGDHNPLHVDPVLARRTIYGEVVVHGVHSLLWALDCLTKTARNTQTLSKLKTDFKRQIRLGDLVSCRLIESAAGRFALTLETNGDVVSRINGSFSHAGSAPNSLPQSAPSSPCRDLTFNQMRTASGTLPLFLDEAALATRFPHLLQLVPVLQLAQLLATTRLVGMECPGLHSLYSSHDLQFDERGGPAELTYQITRADNRFSMLWMRVQGPSMQGTITAFARPRPAEQFDLPAISRMVDRGEFAGQRALVIGGSRGLGEVTAKIIAAGGGEVYFTYHRGQKDAERVGAEIKAAGTKCEWLPFDATCPTADLAAQLKSSWQPTHLYYFATPFISLERSTWFSPDKFEHYCRFYVQGFSRAVGAALKLGGERLTVFYPSSTFVETIQEHSAEYGAAKAAGELLCRHLQKSFPQLRVFHPRLPRMKTDQTSGLIQVEAAEPTQVMLAAIRNLSLNRNP